MTTLLVPLIKGILGLSGISSLLLYFAAVPEPAPPVPLFEEIPPAQPRQFEKKGIKLKDAPKNAVPLKN